MNYEQSQRRHLVSSNIEEAVRSVRDKKATGLVLRGVGEVHVKGQHATVHQGVVTVFDEVDDVVSRRTILVDDVIAVDTTCGAPPSGDMPVLPIQTYVAPSAMATTVMRIMIAALLRGCNPMEIFAKHPFGIAMTARYALTDEVPPALWDVPLAGHRTALSNVIACMPDIVRLRQPLGETSIVHPGNLVDALDDMRAVGMLMTGMFDPEKGREGTPVERAFARDGVREALMDGEPILATDAPSAPPRMPTDVVDTLDTAMVLAGTIVRAIRNEPFVESARLRAEIERAAESMFVLRD